MMRWLPLAVSLVAALVAGMAFRTASDARSRVDRMRSDEKRASPQPRQVVDGSVVSRGEHDQLMKRVLDLSAELRDLRESVEATDAPEPVSATSPRTADTDGGYRRTEPAYSPPPPNGQPVELYDGGVVPSRSLTPVATLVEQGSGRALLYLNEQVEIDHMALEKWSEFFDFGGGGAYARYRTDKPAVLQWDKGSSRGTLVERGTARNL
jgi:hypothetical protein